MKMRQPPSKTVLLLHTLPDGTSHFDWLVDWPGADVGEGTLLTFRVSQFIPALPQGVELSATRLPDHRRLYLSYEGSISSGRGTVQRVAIGQSEVLDLKTTLRLRTQWDSVSEAQLWEGINDNLDPQLWRFVSLPMPLLADMS